MALTTSTHPPFQVPTRLDRIAVGVAPTPESHDGIVLGAAIAAATGAELMLVAIEPDLALVVPGVNRRRIRSETENLLKRMRAAYAPNARVTIDSDLSTARGLRRIIAREHRQLLVAGSSRQGPSGEVTMSRRTRQLLHDMPCGLAIAPRGLSDQPALTLRRIGVGYDGGEESEAALSTAAAIAAGCGAELVVRTVVDDRIPLLGWYRLWTATLQECWQEVVDDEVQRMHDQLDSVTSGLDRVEPQILRGRPGPSLRQLSGEVDLLVIGSRRWGPVARLLLGGAGETLTEGSRCSLLMVPGPATESPRHPRRVT